MRISFFGLGYVGTVYSAGFASKGLQVTGFDIDEEKLILLASGKSTFYEPGLSDLIKNDVKRGTLRVTSDPTEAILNSDITFITVGTPNKKDGSIDLKHVIKSARMIGKALKEKKGNYHLIVIKSTVIPGTTATTVKDIIQRSSGLRPYDDFGLAVNPEFLKEGEAVQGFFNPDRIIIGSDDVRSFKVLKRLYSSFGCPKLFTTSSNAELIKYANNSFLAMKVSFINMLANLCQKIPNSDISIVAHGIGLDKRIGSLFLKAGPGWGGSCWPKDLSALMYFADSLGIALPLIDASCKINNSQPDKLIQLAEELLGEIKGKRIAVLGLSFKPNTDDVRNAVSLKIVESLLRKGAIPIVYDPVAMGNFKQAFNSLKVEYASSAKSCITGAECALIITEWDEFKEIEPSDYLDLMKYPALIDGRRIYAPMKYAELLKFKAIGLLQ